MKNVLLSAAFILCLEVAVQADLVIESKLESPQINSSITTKIQGEKLRADMSGGALGSMSVILDSKSGDSVNLMHGPKIAMKTSGAQMKQTLELAKQFTGAPTGEASKPEKSGMSEKIGDYDCDIYTWTATGTTGRYWVAKNHPQAQMLKEAEKMMNSGILGTTQSGPDISLLPGPVMKTETISAGQTTVITVESVKEQKVDPKDFEVPADYKAMVMPAIPGFGGDAGGGAILAPRRAPAAGGGAAPPPPGAK